VRSNPRHLRLLPAALVTIVVLLGACTGQEQTKSYSATVEREFLFGCTTGGEARMGDGSYVQADTTDPAEKEQIEEAKARMEAEVPEIDEELFLEKAEAAKRDCAVSKALAGVEAIELEAKLVEHAG